jgi:hypothetical protein
VLYLLAVRLVPRQAALASACILAVSPLHIWYSQEARQYTLAVLMVCVSYLALVSCCQLSRGAGPAVRWAWAVAYGLSVLAAMYIDYSAIYALLPQVALLALTVKRQTRGAVPLLVCLLAAVLTYVPWVPSLLSVTMRWGTIRESYLGVTPGKILASLRAVAGFAESGTYIWGQQRTLWEVWPALHDLLVWGVALATVAGTAWLVLRRAGLALLVAYTLLAGTVATAVAVSLVSPGYAERTILYAVPGWAILAGALLPASRHALSTLRSRSHPLRPDSGVPPSAPHRARVSPAGLIGLGAVLGGICMLATASASLHTIYFRADKQHWNELAQDASAAASTGNMVLTYPAIAGILIDLYRSHDPGTRYINIGDGGGLPQPFTDGENLPPVVWFAYMASAGYERPHQELAALGYQRLLHKYYWHALYLDLYAMPQALELEGSEVPLPGPLQSEGSGQNPAPGEWQLPEEARIQGGGTEQGQGQGHELVLNNRSAPQHRAIATVQAQGAGAYIVQAEVRSSLRSGQYRIWVVCVRSGGTWAGVWPDAAGYSGPNDAFWHTARLAALCPADTHDIAIHLANMGRGEVSFKNLKLGKMQPNPTP